jgi:hypothetical protein
MDGWEESKTWLDMAVGNGQLLIPIALIKKKLGHKNWLETLYATDIDLVNVEQFRRRLSDVAGDYPNKSEILTKNIVKENALSWLSYEFETRGKFFAE